MFPTTRASLEDALNDENKFEIISQRVVYQRFLKVTDRLVRFPDQRVFSWDVVGHQYPFVCVMAYFTKDKTLSIIKEFLQGVNQEGFSFVCGGFDPTKHRDYLDAARSELSEELGFSDGTWYSLLDSKSRGITEVKWCSNVFFPFLVIDPKFSNSPDPKDPEEYITPIDNVSLNQIDELIFQGKLSLPSVQTYLMARKKLIDLSL
ncbi:hypothetical protein DSO57_1030156 [Entomophthora muscae]|uniref:Uncharacterized protein n=1 Tax=Entomophthora muscae TaxID=34485 RepID=A0ACC2TMY0_9FUNG|nr:hypothetical protein DSO57_1030156 [Entomophthora muscae]